MFSIPAFPAGMVAPVATEEVDDADDCDEVDDDDDGAAADAPFGPTPVLPLPSAKFEPNSDDVPTPMEAVWATPPPPLPLL